VAPTLPELDALDRTGLSAADGTSFREFRRGLRPRYGQVWRDIFLGYFALGLSVAGLWYVPSGQPLKLPVIAVWALLGALPIGYVVAYIQLFLHEAVHYNIAPKRAANDLLADLFLGAMIGQTVQAYRVVHFEHHKYLGTPLDSERSYFEPLTLRFCLEALFGIKLWRVVSRRKRLLGGQRQASASARVRAILLLGITLNACVIGFAAWHGRWALAAAWPLGVLLVHPSINAIRQVLEHRSFDASSSVDYAVVPHGACTRLFGDGPLACTLGGAGFNRHLLHHWDPQLSYTGFRELERFLLETHAADILRRNTTTYARAAWSLLHAK
jgi:fatty acid desaturase